MTAHEEERADLLGLVKALQKETNDDTFNHTVAIALAIDIAASLRVIAKWHRWESEA